MEDNTTHHWKKYLQIVSFTIIPGFINCIVNTFQNLFKISKCLLCYGTCNFKWNSLQFDWSIYWLILSFIKSFFRFYYSFALAQTWNLSIPRMSGQIRFVSKFKFVFFSSQLFPPAKLMGLLSRIASSNSSSSFVQLRCLLSSF